MYGSRPVVMQRCVLSFNVHVNVDIIIIQNQYQIILNNVSGLLHIHVCTSLDMSKLYTVGRLQFRKAHLLSKLGLKVYLSCGRFHKHKRRPGQFIHRLNMLYIYTIYWYSISGKPCVLETISEEINNQLILRNLAARTVIRLAQLQGI